MTIESKQSLKPQILLFIGIICIGWSAIFVKMADAPAFTSAFYRLFIALCGIIPIWLIKNNKPKISKKAIRFSMLGGLIFACDIACWNVSILSSKAAISTVLANMAPIWVGIATLLLLKDRPTKYFWFGTCLAFIGILILMGFDNIKTFHFEPGNLLAILASLFYACYMLVTRYIRKEIDTVSFMIISLLASSIVLFFICIVTNSPLTGFSTSTWLSLFGMGLIAQLAGWLAINYSLAYIKSTTASITLLSQSIITALIAIPVLGELLSMHQLIGGIVILGGIALVYVKKK